jgi:hypothetical protein
VILNVKLVETIKDISECSIFSMLLYQVYEGVLVTKDILLARDTFHEQICNKQLVNVKFGEEEYPYDHFAKLCSNIHFKIDTMITSDCVKCKKKRVYNDYIHQPIVIINDDILDIRIFNIEDIIDDKLSNIGNSYKCYNCGYIGAVNVSITNLPFKLVVYLSLNYTSFTTFKKTIAKMRLKKKSKFKMSIIS